MKRWKVSLALEASIVVILCVASVAAASPGDKPAQPSDSARVSPPANPQKGSGGGDGDYVGSETCISCHADQERRFKDTVMGKAMPHPRTPEEARGCESCHGPGRAHVEAGGGKDTIPIRFGKDSTNSVAEKNAACEACHSRGDHLFWKGSPHESRA
jgi:Cytochrome c554 and c-prime